MPQVNDAAACGHCDNAINPSRIILCEATCDSATADPLASWQILLGCPTETNVPK